MDERGGLGEEGAGGSGRNDGGEQAHLKSPAAEERQASRVGFLDLPGKTQKWNLQTRVRIAVELRTSVRKYSGLKLLVDLAWDRHRHTWPFCRKQHVRWPCLSC